MKPVAFVLASTAHGTMIVNRFDYHEVAPGQSYGVGYTLLNQSSYNPDEAGLVRVLLDGRRQHFGDGVTVLDAGANIGVFTVDWARHMTGWGSVVAVEAQERVFYALAGNIAVNNCLNARAVWAALSYHDEGMHIPVLDPTQPASFGSLELCRRPETEQIGQPVDYRPSQMQWVRTASVDSMDLRRIDLIKIDVEGMEMDVLEGAKDSIVAHSPILFIENIKTGAVELQAFLDGLRYRTFAVGMNTLAIHPSDPTLQMVRTVEPASPAAPPSV